MFCKNCGKNIKETTSFCPYCGCQIKKKEETRSMNRETGVLMTSILTDKEKEQTQKKHSVKNLIEENGERWIWITGVFIICILAISLIFIFFRKQTGDVQTEDMEAYSVIGEWSSNDFIDLGAILSSQGGVSGWVLEEFFGEVLENVKIVFCENGTLLLSAYDVSASFGTFSYELIGDNRMALLYEVTVVGNTVRIAYTAHYDVSESDMSLDFFGQEITLYRES